MSHKLRPTEATSPSKAIGSSSSQRSKSRSQFLDSAICTASPAIAFLIFLVGNTRPVLNLRFWLLTRDFQLPTVGFKVLGHSGVPVKMKGKSRAPAEWQASRRQVRRQPLGRGFTKILGPSQVPNPCVEALVRSQRGPPTGTEALKELAVQQHAGVIHVQWAQRLVPLAAAVRARHAAAVPRIVQEEHVTGLSSIHQPGNGRLTSQPNSTKVKEVNKSLAESRKGW